MMRTITLTLTFPYAGESIEIPAVDGETVTCTGAILQLGIDGEWIDIDSSVVHSGADALYRMRADSACVGVMTVVGVE